MVSLILLATLGCGGCRRAETRPGETFEAGCVFVPRTPEIKHDFVITNTTARTVSLLEVTHSCTCTTSKLGQDRLKPGESTTLTMNVKLSDVYQDLLTSCRVRTDHPKYPDWAYSLHVRTLPRIRIVPQSVDLGTFRTEGSSKETRASNDSPGPIRVEVFGRNQDAAPDLEIKDVPAELAVSLGRPETDAIDQTHKRTSYPLVIEFRKAEGDTSVRVQPIRVVASDGTGAQVTVVWRTSGPLAIEPSMLHFGMLDRGERAKRRPILVRSLEKRPFRVLSVTSDNPAVRATWPGGGTFPSAPSTSHHLELAFDPSVRLDDPASRVPTSGVVRIETDLPGARENQLRWSVFLRRKRSRASGESDPPRIHQDRSSP